MGLGALVFLPATLLTEPEKMDDLVRYYLQTRPMGWWGPVHREAERRGLIRGGGESRVGPRPFIKRSWTADEAEAWTREDWIVIGLSPLVMASFMLGVASLLLLQPSGVWLTAGALLGSGLIYWVIDPKLRAVSADYEVKQAAYLEDLERGVRWDESRRDPGDGSTPGRIGESKEWVESPREPPEAGREI
jgi:hypothetical protein